MNIPLLACAMIIFSSSLFSQPNCEALKYYYKDTVQYEACKKSEETQGLYQFSKEYQEILDDALRIDPTFAHAYHKKSTAYLKSGDFVTWKKLMDLAVKYDPHYNLEYRGLMRYKCFRDYGGALKDFDSMDSLGMTSDHLNLARSMCHYSMGNQETAIQLLEPYLDKEEDIFGLTGYLHLGVFYLEKHNYKKAIDMFDRQHEVEQTAENHFYMALAYKAIHQNEKYTEHLIKAKEQYLMGRKMSDGYIHPIHKIYLEDIDHEMSSHSIE